MRSVQKSLSIDRTIWNMRKTRAHRLQCTYCLSLLLMGLTSAIITFLLTIYCSSEYLNAFISFFVYRPIREPNFPITLTDIFDNYQPKYFINEKSHFLDFYLKYSDFNFRQLETLIYKSATYRNDTIEVLYRLPRKTKTSALLLIFDACRRTASDWFHTIERQRIIGGAVELGFACLVFQPTDKITGCWSHQINTSENKDVEMVLEALNGFYHENPDLERLPRFSFGSSSGGIFASILAINRYRPIEGQVLYGSIIPYDVLHTHVKTNRYPPTVWIRMLRDVELASEERINISRKIFLKESIPHHTMVVLPMRMIPGSFRDRIPTLNGATSLYIFRQMNNNRWLNYYNYLLQNPRRKSAWKSFIFSVPVSELKNDEIRKNLKENEQAISDLLHVAFAEHEISYERSYEALSWLKETYNSKQAKKNSKT